MGIGTMAVQAGNKMQMMGMILVTGERLNNRELSHYWNGYNITEETESAIQLMPMIKPSTCACSQELEQFHNHQGFTNIRVKGPITQLTTMMNGDGGCRCKGR